MARAQASAHLRAEKVLQERTDTLARLEMELKQARLTGTPQEKLDASSRWNKTRLAPAKSLQELIDEDEETAIAAATLEQLKQLAAH